MGIAFRRLYDRLGWEREVKVAVVGFPWAGKTTIVYKLCLDEVILTAPTIGANVEEVQRGNLRLQLWDIGGNPTVGAEAYLRGAAVVVLVVDCSDLRTVLRLRGVLAPLLARLRARALLVFANKQDLDGALMPGTLCDTLQLPLLRDINWRIQGCCALSGQGLEEGLLWLRGNC